MTGRTKSGPGIRRKAGSGAAGDPKVFGKTTLSEAYRKRLVMPVVHPELLKEYQEATGELLEKGTSPNWMTFIAAMVARRAAMSATGTRDAKELREATEQEGGDSEGEPPIVLGIKGLPRTNAVTGEAPAEETDEEWEG